MLQRCRKEPYQMDIASDSGPAPNRPRALCSPDSSYRWKGSFGCSRDIVSKLTMAGRNFLLLLLPPVLDGSFARGRAA